MVAAWIARSRIVGTRAGMSFAIVAILELESVSKNSTDCENKVKVGESW